VSTPRVLVAAGHRQGRAAVTVAISLHDYGRFIEEALDSVAAQTLRAIELVVVDDASRDDGPARAARWLGRHGRRFVTARLVQQRRNAGLAAARNLALGLAGAPRFFVLDADNALYPRCLECLGDGLRADRRSMFAYSLIETFGEARGLMGTPAWSRHRLAAGNYIDAMALLRTRALRAVGGYRRLAVPGWEDYDLWCRFAERGWSGVRVAEILARYRSHGGSMLNTVTRRRARAAVLVAEMRRRHPWLTITLERH
jgi:glycosyltransferase involved in cell wall biosynthesis